MTSDEEAVQRDRAEKRRRVFRTIRTVVLVVVLLAGAVAAMAIWMATRRAEYAGPWCVWATPTGGTVPTFSPGGTPTPAPAFGDARVTPGGDAAPGDWYPSSYVVAQGTSGTRQVAMLYDLERQQTWTWLLGSRWTPNLFESHVRRTSADGKVWTAFFPGSLNPGASVAPAPDPRCVGTWEFTRNPGQGAASSGAVGATTSSFRFELLPSGEVGLSARPGSTWAVHDGVLVVQDGRVRQGVPLGALYVGVLSDDRRSVAGSCMGQEPFTAVRTDE